MIFIQLPLHSFPLWVRLPLVFLLILQVTVIAIGLVCGVVSLIIVIQLRRVVVEGRQSGPIISILTIF